MAPQCVEDPQTPTLLQSAGTKMPETARTFDAVPFLPTRAYLQTVILHSKGKQLISKLAEDLISKLKLPFTLDSWQLHLISRIQQGYDSVFVAGTGYGKSLIFEGLASTGGPSKTLVIISPLKALERDQVDQAVKVWEPYN
ncbi:hypothetical protein DXG01_014035 [Tephrocybe rancida]|nr:hypothetical protein DXG01_014035 [Tephrocybe rancida]